MYTQELDQHNDIPIEIEKEIVKEIVKVEESSTQIQKVRGNMGAIWTDNTKTSFYFIKNDETTIVISQGSWVTLPERKDKVMIDHIYDLDDNSIGPLGISYLPWRNEEKRFATALWSFKGNSRFIVCYPTGRNKYGMHINWENLFLCDPPDNIDPEQIIKVLYVDLDKDN